LETNFLEILEIITLTPCLQRDKDAHDIYTSLMELAKPKAVTDLYCFSYNPKGDMAQSTGWYFHDIRAEFQRQVTSSIARFLNKKYFIRCKNALAYYNYNARIV
jgi:hypothetical protein